MSNEFDDLSPEILQRTEALAERVGGTFGDALEIILKFAEAEAHALQGDSKDPVRPSAVFFSRRDVQK